MSQALIRAALETALNGMSPAVITSWENVAFTPPASTVPYQRVTLLFAEPADPVMGNALHVEQGILQVSLCYPLQQGDAAVRARVGLIRDTFYRTLTLTSGGTSVIISRTPEAGNGSAEADRWVVPVRIRWFSNAT